MGRWTTGLSARPEHPAWCENVIAAARVRRGELVVVAVEDALVVDGERLVAALQATGARARLQVMPPEPADELSDEDRKLASETDVRIGMAARRRRLTPATHELLGLIRGRGGRVVGMPLMTHELLETVLSQPMPDLETVTRRLLAQLAGARELRVRGRAGTDVTLDVRDAPWLADGLPLEPGGLMNCPYGEVFAVPRSAEGRVVADVTVPFVADGPLAEPVALMFRRGRVFEIEGGAEAERLRKLVAEAGAGADEVAEIGIGLNATLEPIGHVLIDEKVAGTAHVAIGSTIHIGGTRPSEIHVDCVFSGADISADGRSIATTQ
jgi:Thermophilic metalloprotease (M29)